MSHCSKQSAEPPMPAPWLAKTPPLRQPHPPEPDVTNATLQLSDQWYKCGEQQCDGFHGCQFRNRDKLPIDILEILGHGKWGLVKRVEMIGTKEILAMKEVNSVLTVDSGKIFCERFAYTGDSNSGTSLRYAAASLEPKAPSAF